jgi:formylglycine-generating enzyme required for sulfatase activity
VKTTVLLLPLVVWCGWLLRAADPIVTNVRAAQRAGTQLVDITYDVEDPDSSVLWVTVAVSDTGGATATVLATSFTGDVGPNVSPGKGKRIVWDAGKDWPGEFSANMRFRVTAEDTSPAPGGMVLIPAGSFRMGDVIGDGYSDERPLHTVTVSAFYMDKYEVTRSLWNEVYVWAITHGYSFDNWGSGKAADHPVQEISWYDAVKWCNARSEKEGRLPAYYTSAAQTTVYRTGQVNVQNGWVKWDRGYRLPTEAQWEYAARGGVEGKRFPWGDTISQSQANYYSKSSYSYDISPTRGYHPAYATGGEPYTSPVDSVAANGYGLYDMAGNVWEWCWDWHGGYGSAAISDPRGPASGSVRVFRGGGWLGNARRCRVSDRYYFRPDYWYNSIGFRSVLPPGQ